MPGHDRYTEEDSRMDHDSPGNDVLIDNDWSEQERRRYERHAVQFYLRVHSEDGQRLLGEVANISLGGMKLMCAAPLARGHSYRCSMAVSLESGRRESVAFAARCVWTGRDDVLGCENAGLEFIELSDDALASIERIIAELSA